MLPRRGIALPELDLLVGQAVVADVARDRRHGGVGGDRGGRGGGEVLWRDGHHRHHQEDGGHGRHCFSMIRIVTRLQIW